MQIMRSPISEAVPKRGKVTAYNTTPSRVSLKMLRTDLSIRETWMSLRPACNQSVGTLRDRQHAGQQQWPLLQFSAWFSWRRNHFFWLTVSKFTWPSLNSECPWPLWGESRRWGQQQVGLGSQAQGSMPWRTEPRVAHVNIGLYSPPQPFLFWMKAGIWSAMQKISPALTIAWVALCHQLLGVFWLLMLKAWWDPGGLYCVWLKSCLIFF